MCFFEGVIVTLFSILFIILLSLYVSNRKDKKIINKLFD